MENLLNDLTLLGIILTALFTSLGYFYRSYSERKKTIKQVLFYYLELRDVLEKKYISVETIVERYKIYLESIGFTINEEINQLLIKTFEETFKEINIDLDEEFLKKIRFSISELAKIDPVFAFELNNRDLAFRLIDIIINKQAILYKGFYEYVLNDLNSLTLIIAKRVNYFTYMDVKNNIINFDRIEESIKTFDEVHGHLFKIK